MARRYTRVTPTMVTSWVAEYAAGESSTAIARRYGVNAKNVRDNLHAAGVTLRRGGRQEIAVCGTRNGYRRHQRLSEPACQACLDAAAAYRRFRYAAKKGFARDQS